MAALSVALSSINSWLINQRSAQALLPMLLIAALSSCNSSDSSDNEMHNPTTGSDILPVESPDAQPTNPPISNQPPTTENPTASGPNLVIANALPTIDTNGNATWTFDAIASDLEVIIRPYVEMPLASNGAPARWNSMSSFGDRLFAVDEQDGRVFEITGGVASLWFDINEAVQSHTGRTLSISNPFHGGVRGIAFHPDFSNNGKFYASLMEQRPTDITAHSYLSNNSGIDADSVLVEWTADTTTFNVETSSYREVFRVGVPEYDHPIKQIAFNTYAHSTDSDYGNLYIAHGDGSVASTLAGTGQANDALGKILRINPLQSNRQSYTVPTDNPFINDASLPNEVFSYGHRNPHHLAFTTAGHLLATEAGRDNIEEINVITKGDNYGWALREGAYIHLDAGSLINGIAALPDNDAINGFVYPAVQFGHHGKAGAGFTGEALGGGYVVENGSALDGQFFYIDFPKTGMLLHSGLTDILAANTTGEPAALTNAQSYVATIKFDHDSNPDTPTLDNDLNQIVRSASSYVNVNNRVDIRIMQGSHGELYLMSKRNNMVYLVTNSVSSSSR